MANKKGQEPGVLHGLTGALGQHYTELYPYA